MAQDLPLLLSTLEFGFGAHFVDSKAEGPHLNCPKYPLPKAAGPCHEEAGVHMGTLHKAGQGSASKTRPELGRKSRSH